MPRPVSGSAPTPTAPESAAPSFGLQVLASRASTSPRVFHRHPARNTPQRRCPSRSEQASAAGVLGMRPAQVRPRPLEETVLVCRPTAERRMGTGDHGVYRARLFDPLCKRPLKRRCSLTPIRPPLSSRRSCTTRGGVAPLERFSAPRCSDFISGSVRCSAPNTY
jgi:hypothetical protein